MPPLLRQFLTFLWQEKKWWLWPLALVFLILVAIVLLSSGSPLAPFMYPFL